MKIIADSAIPFLRGLLEPYAEVHYIAGSAITAHDVHDADALIVRTRTRCDEHLLSGSRVQTVATATIGFDHIDTAWCASHNIAVTTATGCNARGVLQWVAAALVYLSQRDGWQPAQKCIGVVGVGHVGSLVKEYAEAWGFRVLCCDPPRQQREGGDFQPLDVVAREADIITFHVPFDHTTHHLLDAKFLNSIRPETILINSSRGEVANNAALAVAPNPCILDVWEGEPQLNGTLLNRSLLATPHIAGYSEQGKATATAMVVEALARQFNLPLAGWYPTDAAASTPRAISWQELCSTICQQFDIAAESLHLKHHPDQFEAIRNVYRYRREYF